MTKASALAVGLLPPSRKALLSLSDSCDFTEALAVPDAIAVLREQQFQAIFLDSQAVGLSPAGLDELRTVSPFTPKAILVEELGSDFLAKLAEGHAFRVLRSNVPAFAAEARHLIRPRTSERLDFEGAGVRVTGRVDGAPFAEDLLDLSNRGLSFSIGIGSSFDPFMEGSRLSPLRLEDSSGAFLLEVASATVRHCRVDRASGRTVVRIGASFDDPTMARSSHVRTLTEPLPIVANLRKAARSGAAFTVHVPDRDQAYAFERADVSTERQRTSIRLSGPVPETLQESDVVRVTFDHHGQSYAGLASILSSHAGLHLATPRSLRIHHRRGSNRHRPPPERPYLVRLRAAFTGVDWVRPVLDVNASGFSVAVDLKTDVVPPGLIFDSIELTLPTGVTLRASGVVRGLSRLPNRADASEGSPARCGIQLTDLTPAARKALNDSLLAGGFPQVEVAAEDSFDEIWKFLGDAGFNFHLYSDGSERSLRIASHAMKHLLGPARAVGTNLIYRSEGQIRGHISGLQMYSRTWLATHLAASQGAHRQSERASRALCLGLAEHIESNPSAEFVKFFWQREAKWSSRMFGWAGRAVLQPELAEMNEVLVLGRPMGPPLHGDAAVTLRECHQKDLQLIERYFVETSSVLRIRSDDLSAGMLQLGAVERLYEAGGLERRRRIRVAVVGGVAVGFSLLDDTTAGIQLAEALNAFDVFALRDVRPELAHTVRAALIADAVRFYEAKGLTHAVAFTEQGDWTPYAEAGFKLASHARSLTIHRSLLRSWADVLDLLFQKRRELMTTKTAS